MLKIQEELEEQLGKAGIEVKMHTKDCVIWVLEHGKNCQGCPHELACAKLMQLIFLATRLKLACYTQEGVEDNKIINQSFLERVEKILYAKDIEELKRAPGF